MKLWEGLSRDLNYNVMFSQRGVMNLGHTLQDMRHRAPRRRQPPQRRRCRGADAGTDPEIVPHIDLNTRLPVLGASFQRRAGVARHDAVAWGFARAA